jgi:hypothetical protein
MSSAKIRRDLPNDKYQAAVGANSPSALNVFATIADLISGGGIQHGVAAGTNTYTVVIPGIVSYTDGDSYVVRFTNGSDADSTININGLGAITLTKQPGIQITGGDIIAGQEMILVYDGTNFQCIGIAPNQLFAYVTNDEAITITKGQAVYAFGATGNRMSVKLAFNTSDATSAQTVGVVYSPTIGANQTGFIIVQGVVGGLDTSIYAPGDQLYLGATAGSLTNIKPYAPNHLVYIGIVERANLGNGQIYIRTQNGYELDELHDVDLITVPPVDGDVLTYNSITSLWEPQATFGRFGITDSAGEYTYYTTLTLAMAAAVTGQTIEMFTDYVETGLVTVNLVDGVNVNMNGHTYTATESLSSFTLFNASAVNCQFTNGTILINTASITTTITAFTLALSSDIDCNGVIVRVTGSGKGRGANLGTSSCKLRNLTVFANTDNGITATAGANLFTCFGLSVDGIGITLGNTIASSGINFAYNCIGISTNATGFSIGFNSTAIECTSRSSAQAGFTVTAGTISGGSAFSSTNFGINALTNSGLTANNFRIFGVNVVGLGGIIVNHPGSIGVGRGSVQNCSINSSGNGIEVINTAADSRFNIVQNTIRLSSAANDCIFASVANTVVSYANNIFENSSSPINANITQAVVNTFDNQGNILI